MLQKQLAKWGDQMFEKDVASIVRKHAMIAAFVMMLPFEGVELVPFCIILWHMYSSICHKCNTTLTIGNIIVGVIVNMVIAFVASLALLALPIIGWLGTGFIVYAQFYFSGKAFIETLKQKG